MVDVVIDPLISASFPQSGRLGPCWLNDTVGFSFYRDTANIVYEKTIDGGLTWGAAVVVAAGAYVTFAIWHEKWTSPQGGNVVHMAFGKNQFVQYRGFDLFNETLTGLVTVRTAAADSPGYTTITKAKGGNLVIVDGGSNSAVIGAGVSVSTDDGVSWNPVNSGVVTTSLSNAKVVPGNTANDNDVIMIHCRDSTRVVQASQYDVGADSWTTVLLFTSPLFRVLEPMYEISVRHSDGHAIAPIGNVLAGTNDREIRTFDITDIATITETTKAVTPELSTVTFVSMVVDQQNDNIYVFYSYGANPRPVFYKVSTDGMITWSAEVQFSDGTGNFANGSCPLSIGDEGGIVLNTWRDADTDEWLTNVDNAIVLASNTPSPPSPTPIIAINGGGASEYISYITPDGNVYPLVTPHEFGRFVLSFSGLGTPPIEYITQRGPFQHGATVKDFFLAPRTIQLLIRQDFKDRTDWWAGRATLLDNIRPNRQIISTASVPGSLEWCVADGTRRRINAFIADGPTFEPRQLGSWDEWAFQEVLRFICFDPIFFNPTRVDLSFALTLDAELVFPIDFPIEFGDGIVADTLNVSYVGTWETFPTIVIVGPLENPIIRNVTTGEKLEFAIDIAAGRTVTIDLAYGVKTVVDDLGNNLIGNLSADSNLATWHLAPDPEAANGLNVITLSGLNPTGATSVQLQFFTRYYGF